MGGLFGKPKQSRVTEQDKAVLQLKQQRDKIQQYQKKIETNLDKERQLAKRLIKDGRKDRALLLLKKKRFQEQLLQRTDGQLENLEKMVSELEFSQIQAKVVEGLKTGNESLKKMHEILSIEDVENIMEETQQGIETQREIDELLSGGLTDQDEDAVLEEYEMMFGETEDIKLPDAPSNDLPELEPEREKTKTERTRVAAT
ncbi:putative charged multivesicular body protein 6-like [Apostichopus japonicus]|uniref:Putative charged multivesicular body protein 6-like n=1 Tax=Stichopus japonicus TaxID=307972 RepID=A0A2G8KZ32_STIJA|nr:putative charged multivesicular body protein 6-like [Apostichopus japonicus]